MLLAYMKQLLIALFSIALVLVVVWLFTRYFDDDDEVVIVTAHYKENLEWLKRSNMKVVVCDKPGADPMPFPPDPKCSLDQNRGREASVFLKYIIENYDNLPKYVAFIHGHEEAWHQSGDLLESIRRAKKEGRPYISLNNRIDLRCDDAPKDVDIDPTHSVEDRHAAFILVMKKWDEIFGPILNIPRPRYFRFQCCAQFIVSRDAILRHSKIGRAHV